MQTAVVISGLVGALLSGVLGFAVRLYLDKRAQLDAERRIAYVYLVRVSEFVAAEVVVRSAVKVFVPASSLGELGSLDGAFEPSHKVSALIAEALTKLPADEVATNPNYRVIPRLASVMLEAAAESRLSLEQLAKLPKDAVFACHQFQNYHRHVCQVVSMWAGFFERDERYWITAEGIHDQWRALTRFADQARAVRNALIRYGAATPAQATALLSSQVNEIHRTVVSKFEDKPKVLAAEQAAEAAAKTESTG